ncbi:hypothetical protein GCM10011505_06190 [Tistrella bauzanensis]|uniref:Uncharacterized protein n=1 Tax=Tistrella bauzanensis TaxID=657419 RepID=A0ABQ1I8M4_9PROT|nr:hypothetical protein GCM10011505_06190 [Tistrella bauzanensis]
MWIGQPGILSGDHDIGQKGDGGAQADGVAVHPADDRPVAIQHAKHDPAGIFGFGGEVLRIRRSRRHVAAGAEGPAGAGENDHADTGRDGRMIDRLTQFAVHDPVERIQPVRTVQGRGEDLVAQIGLNGGPGWGDHGRSPGRLVPVSGRAVQ